jgi:hypothetical protein
MPLAAAATPLQPAAGKKPVFLFSPFFSCADN